MRIFQCCQIDFLSQKKFFVLQKEKKIRKYQRIHKYLEKKEKNSKTFPVIIPLSLHSFTVVLLISIIYQVLYGTKVNGEKEK